MENQKEDIFVLDEGIEESTDGFSCCMGPLIPWRF